MSKISNVKHIAILNFVDFTFLNIISSMNPVASNNYPAAIKSNKDQFTASVNCIATNGMSNIIPIKAKMI